MDNIRSGRENVDHQSPRKRRRRESADKDDPIADSSCQYNKLLSSLDAASSRIGKSATPRFVETLIPNINDADTTPMIEILHKRIEDDPKILERLLSHYYRFGMEDEFEKLDNGGHSRKYSRKRGWKEMVIGKVVNEGLQAEHNDEKLYALKCCRPNKRAKICHKEYVRSLRGIIGDSWLLKPNHKKDSEYTGVRVTLDDLYDMNSKEKRKRTQFIGYQYTPVVGFNDGVIDGQYPAFHAEQIGTLWSLALFPSLTLNRNCYWKICLNCQQSWQEFGILRVDTRSIKNGKAGYNDQWSDEVLDAIGAQPHQRLTLKPRESGEKRNPERVFVKYYASLAAHWEKVGRPESGWILIQELCEDYDRKNLGIPSNLYNYWKCLHGLAYTHNIELSEWRLTELARIEIYPNRAEIVEKVKEEIASQKQRKIEEYTQKTIARKEAVLNAMADEVDESEEEEDDFFVNF